MVSFIIYNLKKQNFFHFLEFLKKTFFFINLEFFFKKHFLSEKNPTDVGSEFV